MINTEITFNDIGRKGNGPGEYASVGLVSVDPENKWIFLSPNKNIQVYGTNGRYIKSFSIPDVADYDATAIFGNVYCSIINIRTGKEKVRLYYFDDRGILIDSTSNRISYIKREHFYSGAERGKLVPAKSHFLFKDGVNDTIYLIDSTLNSIPYFRIDLGDYKMPYKTFDNTLQEYSKASLKYITLFDVMESDSFLFLNFNFNNHYPFNYGKESLVKVFGKIMILHDQNVAALYNKQKCTLTLLNGENGFGFINDIDGGMPFWPSYIELISGEMYSWVNAFDFYDYMKSLETAKDTIRDKEAHARLNTLMENFDAAGNPIIIKISAIRY
ncbi:MAG TPA: 6-bladed beta-propeller [Bacteroidales bacterium]|nr:6-bladed beta-propeller [Bacteroidales bacterium]